MPGVQAIATDHYISAVVTDIRGNYLAELPQAIKGAPFRAFAPVWEFGGNGSGALEYRLDDNPLLDRLPKLFDPTLESLTGPNLVWMTFRGKVCVWIVEMDSTGFDRSEASSEWVPVSGAGVRKLLYDRVLQPDAIVAGDYVQLSWTSKYAVIASNHVGTILMAMLTASNSRFGTQITAGTIQIDAATNTDLWSGQFRFENIGQAADAFEAAGFGRATVDGVIDPTGGFKLVFNWFLPAAIPAAPLLSVAGVQPHGGGVGAGGYEAYGETPFTATAQPDVFDGINLPVTFREGVDLAALKYNRSSADAASHMIVESQGPDESGYTQFAWTDLRGPGQASNSAMRVERYVRASMSLIPAARAEASAAATKRTLDIEVDETVHRAITNYDLGHYVRVVSSRHRVDVGAQIRSLMVAQQDDKLAIGMTLGGPGQDALGKAAQIGQQALDATDAAARQPI